jgi:hypothetical protein
MRVITSPWEKEKKRKLTIIFFLKKLKEKKCVQEG